MQPLDSVRNRHFDVVVAGGGIIGAGVARDAALRGFSVALFEKGDYGGGTTAGSTRLIHGGLRYLEMLDFGLVRMDLREREILLRIAPHLVKPLEFLIPFYDRSLLHRWKMHAGMLLYDALSYDKSLPRYRVLGGSEVMEAEPSLRRQGLQGGVTYYDAQVEMPERLAVENIVDARSMGAVTCNYVDVVGPMSDARGVTGVRVRDTETGEQAEVRARVVINATGPWFNMTPLGNVKARIRTTKGVHLTCPLLSQRAIVLFSKRDGRLFFVIPLMGLGWIGTTDTDYAGDPRDAVASAADVDYLMQSTGEFVPTAVEAPIYWTNAGVRALVMQRGRESEVTRSHRIQSSPGLVSILGGKITGYRSIASEAVDQGMRQLRAEVKCSTAERMLPGAQREENDDLEAAIERAVNEEQCRDLAGFMLRRSKLGFRADQGLDVSADVARMMGVQLGWSAARIESELVYYRQWVLRTRQPLRERAGNKYHLTHPLGI